MITSCLKLFLFLALFNVLEASHNVNKKLRITLESAANNVAFASPNQPYRTAFHFQPPKNWMNDPNGPMIYKGIYHLFYQYNPKGAVWGNIVWAHSTSKDLVNWTPHKPAIFPSQPSDINGCWSGSATILPTGEPAIIYTGINHLNQQIQNLALPKNPSDPYLKDWLKSPHNPLMYPNEENQINATSFRDPTTAWLGPDKKWRVIVGSKVNDKGMAILYKSKDFVNWVKAENPLHSAAGTGMWECPDFFPVNADVATGIDMPAVAGTTSVKYVLKKSLDDNKHDHYTIGDYDQVNDVYLPDEGSVDNGNGLRYDYGKFYASKTFFDSVTHRRILWGWVNESATEEQNVLKGWSGIQAIPRNVYLDKSRKQLVQWPIKEIEKLRKNPIHLPTQVLKQGSLVQVSGITAAQADVEISFKVTDLSKAEEMEASWTDPQLLCSQKGLTKGGLGPFGLLVLASKDTQEHTSVFFRIFKLKSQSKHVVLMCSDQSRSSMHSDYDKTTYGAFVDVNPLNGLSLRSLIDHSVVESFGGGGKSCITARVYPTVALNEAAHLFAFNNGSLSVTISKLTAWSMNKAQIN